MTSAPTGSTATSNSARAASNSPPSAATSAASTRPRSGCTSVLDNFSPHKGETVRQWAADHNVELAYTLCASWLSRIEARFRALRYFALAGIDHPDHATQARLFRRYVAWRNRNTGIPRLRALVKTANVA